MTKLAGTVFCWTSHAVNLNLRFPEPINTRTERGKKEKNTYAPEESLCIRAEYPTVWTVRITIRVLCTRYYNNIQRFIPFPGKSSHGSIRDGHALIAAVLYSVCFPIEPDDNFSLHVFPFDEDYTNSIFNRPPRHRVPSHDNVKTGQLQNYQNQSPVSITFISLITCDLTSLICLR